MLEANRVIGNMVLFKCNVCSSRFPTYHPEVLPPLKLRTTATCNVDVAEWDEPPEHRNSTVASLHTGVCATCSRHLKQVKDHPMLDGVNTFAAQNRMDPLMGFHGDVRLRKHILF